MKIKTLLFGALSVLLLSCGGSSSGPEGATKAYVTSIASAEYDKALEVSTGTASETVQQMKDDDTKGYETKIIEINCEIDQESETAKCKCTERRIDTAIFMDYKYDSFQYDLEKIEGKWKVSSQTKDMAMPDFGDMSLGEDDMMDDMPMEESVMTDEHEGHDHGDGHDHSH